MGEHDVQKQIDPEALRRFTKQLLTDVRALEQMLEEGLFESHTGRIGAEQELFLIDRHGHPAPLAMEVLEAIDDDRFTTELARFNLEFNLDPIELGGKCLSALENQMRELMIKVNRAAEQHDARVVLAGILPTLEQGHLSIDNMTPATRYYALNDATQSLRGENFQFQIKGVDELRVTHDNVMLEACNTSFQLHLQVGPDDFARLYNLAQAVAAPVLAVATNSPLLFGKRLWRETRIALFQQSIDTRTSTRREQRPRVSFGTRWVDDSVLEIFKEDIAHYRILLSTEIDEDPFAELAEGRAPNLTALRLHNGTIYRWNRPCYGISSTGRPHLRVENRVLPAGPTVVDEMANAAFWFGLMRGVLSEYGDISQKLDFDLAMGNFVAAARLGLGAQFSWPGHENIPAQELILGELLPLARQGLESMSIATDDIDRYLIVLAERVETGRTGSQWLLDSLANMKGQGTAAKQLSALVASTHRHQAEGKPVTKWTKCTLEEVEDWRQHYVKVGQIMSTDLITVNQHQLVDLAAQMMDWEHLRHIPVEDDDHRLVGLVTHRSLLRLVSQGLPASEPIAVGEIMVKEIFTVTAETPTLDAIRLMHGERISCLPVVNEEGRLIGIVSERDFIEISRGLLEEFLAEDGD